MELLTDISHKNKLDKYNINIKTKYIVGNKILERNTNNSHNDDITNGIRCEKDYYVNNQLIETEKKFDSRIEYTFISKDQENIEYMCPNCGMKSKLKDVDSGCPYCHTYYNIDYTKKDLGGKYHYDRVLHNTSYRLFTGLIDIIISLLLAYLYILSTSRTFNAYDFSKVFIYGLILALILYYFFYAIDAYIILTPIKKYKDNQNNKQKEFWKRTNIDKTKFFNNFNYEVRSKYYNNTHDIIDFDIIDFDEFVDYTDQDILYVKVKAYVRTVKYLNGKFIKKYQTETYTMKKINDKSLELDKGTNVIKCHNCGASIDASKEKCEYCDTAIKHLQEWILID